MNVSPEYIAVLALVGFPALAVEIGSIGAEQAIFFYLSFIIAVLLAMHGELVALNRD